MIVMCSVDWTFLALSQSSLSCAFCCCSFCSWTLSLSLDNFAVKFSFSFWHTEHTASDHSTNSLTLRTRDRLHWASKLGRGGFPPADISAWLWENFILVWNSRATVELILTCSVIWNRQIHVWSCLHCVKRYQHFKTRLLENEGNTMKKITIFFGLQSNRS